MYTGQFPMDENDSDEPNRDERMVARGYDPTCHECEVAYANDPDVQDEAWAANFLEAWDS